MHTDERRQTFSAGPAAEVCLFFSDISAAAPVFREAVHRLAALGISFLLRTSEDETGRGNTPGLAYRFVFTDRPEKTGQAAWEAEEEGLSGVTFFCDEKGFPVKDLSFLSVFGQEGFHTYPFSMELLALPEWTAAEKAEISAGRRDSPSFRRGVLWTAALLLYGTGKSRTLLEACDRVRSML